MLPQTKPLRAAVYAVRNPERKEKDGVQLALAAAADFSERSRSRV